MTLETDGIEYEILQEAIRDVKGVPGLFCEIGTRRGGSMQIIISAALATGQDRHFVSVDPYGNIPYNDGRQVRRYDYTNDMKKKTLADLYTWVQGINANLITFTLTDKDFFERFDQGVPVYDQERQLINQYAFVFLDGPHDLESINWEVDFFAFRMPSGAQMVVDNIEYFDVEKMVEYCQRLNIKEVSRNNQKIRLCKL